MGQFETYRRYGHRIVSGWLESEVLEVIATLDATQRARNISGAVTEIGVHHGKLFIGLRLLQKANEAAVAIDVFGDQELNVDNSGKGNLEAFRKNVRRWSSLENVTIHQGDSTRLTADKLVALARGNVRLFSVDGGHTESIVLSDMRLAEATLTLGGIVIADDIFNQAWPGVAAGTFKYMNEGGALVPFAVGFNKVFFTAAEFAESYRSSIQAEFGNRYLTSTRDSEFGKYPVLVLARVPRTPARLAGRVKILKAIYRRVQTQLRR